MDNVSRAIVRYAQDLAREVDARAVVLYADAIRLVREVPGVREVRGIVQVADAGTVSVAQRESARLQIEIQQRLPGGGQSGGRRHARGSGT